MLSSPCLLWLEGVKVIWRRKKIVDEDLKPQIEEARREKEKAIAELSETKCNSPMITQLVGELVEAKKRNHFGESIELVYHGRLGLD